MTPSTPAGAPAVRGRPAQFSGRGRSIGPDDLGAGFTHRVPLSTLLARVEALFTAEFDQRLAQAGMNDISFSLGTNVLRFLDPERGVRLVSLVEMSGVTKQAISQQVAFLQQAGYVTVDADPADSRAKQVRLTPKGTQSQHTARQLFRELEAEWADRYGDKQLTELRCCLEQILVANTDTGPTPRTPRKDRP